jgi:hypothetical protein
MRRLISMLIFLLTLSSYSFSQAPYPVRGLCIAAPSVNQVDEFSEFIRNELAPAGLNLLILRVDWNYEYKSHPELRGNNPLTKEDVNKLVAACSDNNIRLIPQINLFGHQSWHGSLGKLLEVYPEFDETPQVQLPENYEWPNDDGLYCKSYCPRHPDVHKVVFALVDEIVEVFETDGFHAGLDEVFYIGHEQCERCYGHDKAELFANEVTKIRDHLAQTGTELWMWGDRLIDGKTTGIGLWEGSYNNTHRAIDMIPKDVVICDWHYERPDPTAFLFASKGFNVVTCPWRTPEIAVEQEKMMRMFIETATKAMQPRYQGMLQTVWGSAKNFMDSYNGTADSERVDKSADSFKELSKAWKL